MLKGTKYVWAQSSSEREGPVQDVQSQNGNVKKATVRDFTVINNEGQILFISQPLCEGDEIELDSESGTVSIASIGESSRNNLHCKPVKVSNYLVMLTGSSEQWVYTEGWSALTC